MRVIHALLKSLRECWFVVLVCWWTVLMAGAENDSSLIGYWPLTSDCQDASEYANHGEIHGATFVLPGSPEGTEGATRFDGRDDFIEVADNESLDLGTGDFTISVWVYTAEELDDVLGDIVSKFNPQTRQGFQLGIKNNVGVTTSQANYRNVQFGIDNAIVASEWTERGRPGQNTFVFTLAVFEGNLYAGTCEPGPGQSGRVYRYQGGTTWADCGSPDPCNSVASLAVYRGEFYAAVSKYRLSGSSLEESENPNPGGKVYRYKADGQWIDCGQLPGSESIGGMVVFRDRLYASSMYSPGLFRYEGGQTWTSCGSPDGKRVEALCVFNGAIYASGYDEAGVYRYDGETWTHLGCMDRSTQTYGFTVYEGDLYVSSWPTATVFRYQGGTLWENVGRLGEELESMPLVVYNGKMYSGSLPSAEVFRYDGMQTWTSMGRIDLTPDVKYRRAWSMAVYQGELFAGTLPSGHVKSLEAGKNVTCDGVLPAGWHHIAATKDSERLRLYIDGEQVAVTQPFAGGDYDLSNDAPLRIGFGSHDYLNGSLRELRMYKRALSGAEIAGLAK